MNHDYSITTAPVVYQSHQHLIQFEIENFVKDIIQCDESGILGTVESEYQLYTHLLGHLPRYLSVYSTSHDFCKNIEVFWSACDSAGLLPPHAHFGDIRYPMQMLNRESAALLVNCIVLRTRSAVFKRHIYDRRYQVQANECSLEAYTDQVLRRYSKTLVVRVDLGYLKNKQHLVTVDDVFLHRDAFIRLIHPFSIFFNHLHGYAWAMEQGEDKGYHIHFAFCFNGSERQNGSWIGMRVGQLWQELTGGMGMYFNCNGKEHVDKFERQGMRGVGKIMRNNPDELANAQRTLGYLAKPDKEDQYLRMRPKGARTFGKGTFKIAESDSRWKGRLVR